MNISGASSRVAWNKGRLVGQKRPLLPKEVWAIRVRLQIKRRKRDLAMFNLAIDSKLRGYVTRRRRMSSKRCGSVPATLTRATG
jgi:hypothetical protein